jgi:hypothetical protein
MTYRDDRDAAGARADQLEKELEAARDEIARLRGEKTASNAWLGGPSRIQIERTIEGEISEAALEPLIERLRARSGHMGRIERLGSTIAWSTDADPRRGTNFHVRFTIKDGVTIVRIEENLRRVAGGIFGGIIGGAGGAGAINAFVWAGITGSPLLAAAGAGWLALVYGITRTSYGAYARSRVRKHEVLITELEEAVREAIPRVRVEAEAAREEEEVEVAAERSSARSRTRRS